MVSPSEDYYPLLIVETEEVFFPTSNSYVHLEPELSDCMSLNSFQWIMPLSVKVVMGQSVLLSSITDFHFVHFCIWVLSCLQPPADWNTHPEQPPRTLRTPQFRGAWSLFQRAGGRFCSALPGHWERVWVRQVPFLEITPKRSGPSNFPRA